MDKHIGCPLYKETSVHDLAYISYVDPNNTVWTCYNFVISA
jgi:hypothetical protein